MTKPRKTHDQFAEELAAINPGIELTTRYVMSTERIGCRCKLCGYEWSPKAYSLLSGRGCPACARTKTSFMEKIFLFSFRKLLGDENVLSDDRNAIGMELDVYVPLLKVAVEPGSWVWHGNLKAQQRDEERRARCLSHGIRLATVYDSFPSNQAIPFEGEGLFTFDEDFNVASHQKLHAVVNDVLAYLGIADRIDESEWTDIELKAHEACHRKTTAEFKNELEAVDSSIEVIGEYLGSKDRIKCRCKKCGYEWSPIPNSLLNGHGCPKCGIQARARKKTATHAEYAARLAKINPTIELLSTYTKAMEPILCRCRACGYEWQSTPSELLSYGCPKCGAKKAHLKTTKSQMEFEKDMSIACPKLEVIGDYINQYTKVRVRCRQCGREWEAMPKVLLRGTSCRICSEKERRRVRNEEFKVKLREKNPNIEPIDDYVNNITKMHVRCALCGMEWMAWPRNLLLGYSHEGAKTIHAKIKQ